MTASARRDATFDVVRKFKLALRPHALFEAQKTLECKAPSLPALAHIVESDASLPVGHLDNRCGVSQASFVAGQRLRHAFRPLFSRKQPKDAP